MDLLNKATGHLAELFKSMTPGARVAVATLIIATIVVVGYWSNGQFAGADAYLMDGESFSPSQLRDMQAALGQAGLEAHVDGGRMRVPRGQESKYMAALAEGHALPADFGDYQDKALSSGSLLPMFRGQQEAAGNLARQKELQLAIRLMAGIENVQVLIDQTRSHGFPRDKNIITAAVGVLPKGNQALDARTARTIRDMVASSVAGLKPEGVTVVDLRNHRSMPGSAADAAGGFDEYADYKERQELDWQQKINHVLEYIPGVLVSTNVEFDTVGLSDQRTGPSISTDPAAPKPLAAGRSVKRVSVSVVVPQNYYEAIWRKEHPTPPGKRPYVPEAAELAEVAAREKTKVETLVTNLLPARSDRGGAGSQVAVSTSHAPQTPSQPAWSDEVSAWFEQHWAALSVAGLVIIGLMTLHSTVKSFSPTGVSADQTAAPAASPFSLVRDDEIERGHEPIRLDRPGRGATVPIHDELADIVRDDPDAAASILRTWIGNAS